MNADMDKEKIAEAYCFLRLSDSDLEHAAQAIKMISKYKIDEVQQCLIRYVAIAYSRPFSKNNGMIQKIHRLDKSFVPMEFSDFHDEILKYRNELWTHSDIAAKNPKLLGRIWHLPLLGDVIPIQVKTDSGADLLFGKLANFSELIAGVRIRIAEEQQKIIEKHPDIFNRA